MKNKSLFHVVFVAALAISLQACGDDNKSCSPSSCSKPAHAIEMMCSDNGSCQVKVCDTNYNISQDKKSCVSASENTCVADQCSKPDHATEMMCSDNGTCQVKTCENNYNVSLNKLSCVSASENTCVADQCSKPAHATVMECIQNQCAVADCETNYEVSTNKDACEPNGSSSTANCYDDTYKCLKNNLMTCQNGNWVVSKECNTQICDERQLDCVDGAVNPASVDVVSTTPCSYSTEESCEGEVANFCNEDGFMTQRDCSRLSTSSHPLSCKKMNDDNFVDCVSSCDPNAWVDYTTCSGNYVEAHTCEKTTDGSYHEFAMTGDPCTYACYQGKCVREGEAPIDGDSCDARFENTCWNGDMYTCVDGKIMRTICPGDSVCALRYGTSTPICTTKCSGAAASIYGCKTEKGVTRLDNKVCEIGQDAAYYFFPETDVCQSSCNQGLCDHEIPEEDKPCDPASFEDICFQNNSYYCHSEQRVVMMDVCSNRFCRYLDSSYGFSGAYSDCVIPCSEGDEALLSCAGKGARAYETRDECTMGSDGSFYRFYFENRCSEAGCNGDVCAE